jgi:sugar lactone lactonase YvrE
MGFSARLVVVFRAPALGVLATLLGTACADQSVPGGTVPTSQNGFSARTRWQRGMISPTYPTSKGLLFESDWTPSTGSRVQIYTLSKFAENPSPIATISDAVHDPYGMVRDSSGTLYVANGSSSTVTEYPRGKTKASATIKDGVNQPFGLAKDSAGTLYVGNTGGSQPGVAEYPPGSATPSALIGGYGREGPGGMTLDRNGALFAGCQRFVQYRDFGDVCELLKGTTQVAPLHLRGLGTPTPRGLAFDKEGRLWVATSTGTGGVVITYKLPFTKPIAILRNVRMPFPTAIDIDVDGTIVIATGASKKIRAAILAFKQGASKPYADLTRSIYGPQGVLIASP